MRNRSRVRAAVVTLGILAILTPAACSVSIEGDPAPDPVPETVDLTTPPAPADLGLDVDDDATVVLESDPPVEATVLLPGASFTMPTATLTVSVTDGVVVDPVLGDTGQLDLGAVEEAFRGVLADLAQPASVADEFVTAATTADADQVTSPWVNLVFGDTAVGIRAEYDPRSTHGRVIYSVTWD
ncbi:hypothetical protein Bcav_1356 [Beutenbergia cavernae DSM 12333]|uniref:Lipoprotein n=1 Tax=Beutenbergia cavernae (strain ATCC BAA-8 / DSM 12333 / CCUG 43141 / JCM 11478 / NBRC 16432 / NCIMB 13614 / HKI 0122) TaxID=471853 RepID=C5C2C9_BEUC1|nr:hypothetical protein [Beutenbergia cavernae]ACQ79615.1 hypothetical protein Bcav_1356 [Beutenbergia cavernae DSM 12333]